METFSIALPTIFFAIALTFFVNRTKRSADDVLCELEPPKTDCKERKVEPYESGETASTENTNFLKLGFETARELRAYERRLKTAPVLVALAVVAVIWVLLRVSLINLAVLFVVVYGACYIVGARLLARKEKTQEEDIRYYLPLIMERFIMAASSGHDVYSSIATLISLEGEQAKLDPVTSAFKRVITLTEKGVRLEDALTNVADRYQNVSLRHAFTHLAIAHREGAGLIAPLRELSDATHNHYQDAVEEEIAKLPVYATAPLVCAFAGIILIFLTAPLMQIMNLTALKVGG